MKGLFVLCLFFSVTLMTVQAGLFKRLKEKIKNRSHLKGHEEAPTDEVDELLRRHGSDIKKRAKLPVKTRHDEEELRMADVRALGYKKLEENNEDIYLIRVIIGDEYIVHVKISVPRHNSKKHKGSSSTLMTVLSNKKEGDKIDERLYRTR